MRRTRPEGPLGEALDAWIWDRRVSIAHIMRVSGIARNTIMLIIKGVTRHPELSTLDGIAKAIATDPRTHDLDSAVYARCYQDMIVLAGHAPPGAAPQDSLLLFSLISATGSRAQAEAWVALIAEYAGLDPDGVRALGSGRPVRRRARAPDAGV